MTITFSKTEIRNIISELEKAEKEQLRIADEALDIIGKDLAMAWSSEAQKAYAECFVKIADTTLNGIQNLLLNFKKALQYADDNLENTVKIMVNQVQQ